MALILTAPGVITNPTAQLPDIETGRYLAWDARDVASVGNNNQVASWPARFKTDDTLASRASLEALGTGGTSFTLPAFVANARAGVPAVRFGGMALLAAGWRSTAEPEAALRKLSGVPLTYTVLARQHSLPTDGQPIHRVFDSANPHGHRLRANAAGQYRMNFLDNGGTTIAPASFDMPGAVGNWFALTLVFDKARSRFAAVVNGGSQIVASPANLPAYWSQLVLGREVSSTMAGAVPYDYAAFEMHSRALSLTDIRELHAKMKREFGVTDF